ncbi:MAG: type I methionyl aminopeptidase [Deltaproteobacteria bacterium]|nr:type I methionyl aminopeptidase [Deltaproteobacteria bacterium]
MARDKRGIVLKSAREIELMRRANRHVAEILDLMCKAVAPGVSTWDLDQIARRELKARGITSAFLGYRGFPATVCASINEEIVHGIPSKNRVLKDGDIISLDFGAVCEGYVGDSARTVPVGKVSAEAEDLMRVTAECLEHAIAACHAENRLSEVGAAVEKHATQNGFAVVREFVGHGIGTAMHEEPQVPNYFDGPRPRMKPGLVIAIEPMVNVGTHEVEVLADGWTAVTRDRKLSAHFEHSVAITDGEPIVLSRL